MLPKLRRVSSILRGTNENSQITNDHERSSNKSSSSSVKSTDDANNVYIETLLYIVHVDDIDMPVSINDEINDDMYDAGDEQQQQQSNLSTKLIRRLSKRTTASFNQRQQLKNESVYSRPSLTFSNPLRRLNSLLKSNEKIPSTPKLTGIDFPLYSSTVKKSSSFNKQCQSQNQNQTNEQDKSFPLPPPSFVHDDSTADVEQRTIIRAIGPGLTDGFVDENCHFDLNAPNVELQKLVIAIDGPSKADIQIDVVDKDIYRVFYNCQIPGSYHISLTYNGEHIDSSPYHLRLRSQSTQEQVVPPTLPPPNATIEPIEFYVNTPCIVTVRPASSCAVFQAFIQAPQANTNLPITVHKSAKSECYEIYFVPTTSGNHYLNISLNHIPIVDNPCRLVVRPSPSKSISASGQGLFHAYTGESSHFFVSKSSNDSQSETGTFSVGISGPSTVFLDANETEHGYEFHYKPTRTGKYLISIKNGGKHIQGSPFICCVYNKLNECHRILSTMYENENDLGIETTSCTSLTANQTILSRNRSSTSHVDLDILRSSMRGDASQVCVFGTGLYEAKPRRKATFRIDTTQTGPGLLLVGLYSSLGPSERLVIKQLVSPSSHLYKVSYRVRKRGQYMLVILYGSTMQHVPGSPYLVLVE